MNIIKSILGWFFGIIFALGGLSSLFAGKDLVSDLCLGVAGIVVGAMLIPPAWRFIRHKTSWNPTNWQKTGIIFALFFLGGLPSSLPELSTTMKEEDKQHQIEEMQEAEQQREKDAELNYVVMGKQAVLARLKDPDSAKFQHVYFHRGIKNTPVVCGEVNSKNGFGGYVGYQAFISGGKPELTYLHEDPDFAYLWKHLCAD